MWERGDGGSSLKPFNRVKDSRILELFQSKTCSKQKYQENSLKITWTESNEIYLILLQTTWGLFLPKIKTRAKLMMKSYCNSFLRKIGSDTTHHHLFHLETLLILRHMLNILGISVTSVSFFSLDSQMTSSDKMLGWYLDT